MSGAKQLANSPLVATKITTLFKKNKTINLRQEFIQLVGNFNGILCGILLDCVILKGWVQHL